jgi:hypothetical protein
VEDHRGGSVSYTVTAPLVLAQDQSGHTHHVYAGGIIEWLSDAQAEHFLAEKLVVETGAAPEAEADPGAVDGAKPPHTAKKDVLVAWIVDNVAKEDGADYTADELNELNKAQLSGLIDSVE